jgi:hypothetical protein
MGAKIASLIVLISLAACQSGGGSFCAIAKPMRPSREAIAAMSDREINEALAHDRKGQKLCGWKP